jgi:hypothetical protein
MSPLQTRYSHLHDEPRYSWAGLFIIGASSLAWAAIILAGKQLAHSMGWL